MGAGARGGTAGAAGGGLVVGLLGPVEVASPAGGLAGVGRPMLRVLVALLAVAPGRVVPDEALVDGLWGEEWSREREQNLHTHVSALRRLLAAAEPGRDGPRVVRSGGGYRLVAAETEVDAGLFQSLARRGLAAARAGDVTSAAGLFGQALGLWRGAALADVVGLCSRLAGDAARLEELRAGVVEERLDCDLVLGRHTEVATEGPGLVAEFPLRERLAGQVMVALYRCGRRGEALAVYDTTRRALAEQLGLDPGPELAGLQAKMLADDPSLAAPASAPAATGTPASAWKNGPVLRLAPRSPFLAGREELLAGLDAQLAGDDGSGPRTVVLSGLGGAGKTSVAVEYAHRHLTEVGVAWQFPAENTAVLAAGFTDLAAQLGGAGGGEPVALVHSVLAGYPQGWLLVFDNARDRASVAAFVPPAGNGRVLITSRDALWPPRQLVEVPVLDIAVASEFLVERTGDPDQQAAAGVAEAVGGLPLALEQAGAYIQATGGSLAGYLESFQQRRADLLARGDPAGYPGTVATTWVLAFRQLEESVPTAAGLLRLLAFCAPEAVPLGLLLEPRRGLAKTLSSEVAAVLVPLLEDDLTAKDAVAALRRYSLARPAGDGAVSVHRLVQAVTADQMPAELADAWRQAAAVLVEAALPGDPAQPATWPRFAALVPHAQAALPVSSGAMDRIADYLGYSGGYVAAREFSGALLEDRARILGPEHPSTLSARCHLAFWTGEAGDAAAARDQFTALLPVEERALGPEHPETLSTRGYLALWTGEAGDAAGARDQLTALLPVEERVLGPEHPDTLNGRGYLALYTGRAGDAAGARDQYAALLPIGKRVLGPEHTDTLVGCGYLALWTGEAGDAAGARDQYAALLTVEERVLGPEHPATLITRAELARWTGEAGDASGARDQYAALLPIFERVLGPEQPHTLTLRHNLARWAGRAGDEAGSGVD